MIIISILTIFPDLFDQFLKTSFIGRLEEKGLVKFKVFNLLSTTAVKVRIDAPTVGPGPGMLLKPEVIEKGLAWCASQFGPSFNIFFTPQGKLLDQPFLNEFASSLASSNSAPCDSSSDVAPQVRSAGTKHIALICGRYEGFDSRTEAFFADLQLSIGDYVLMGGELPAQVFLEGLCRLIPGVLGNSESVATDSFQSPLLDHSQFSKPDVWNGLKIPEVLLSGDHGKINQWRISDALNKTLKLRFDFFRAHRNSSLFGVQALGSIPPHYVVLMHSQVLNKEGLEVVTSCKSIDLHDISRASTTYGFKKFFVVQPLFDQQEIVKSFSAYWASEEGEKAHGNRQVAIGSMEIFSTLEEVVSKISTIEGLPPIVIATSARNRELSNMISYHDQGKIWSLERPVVLVLGTGYGLTESFITQCDYVLRPICGMTKYNHLSVRSAAAIIFDRWLGLNQK